MPTPRRVRIGSVWIDSLTFDGAVDAIERLIDAGCGGSVYTPNVDHVVQVESNAALASAYARASLALADGQPVVWASRLLGTPLPAKISGSDLFEPLMRRAAARGYRVYLLGGTGDIAQRCTAKLEAMGVVVAGHDSPLIPAEEAQALAKLRAARADLVVVALGAPKQELFIARNDLGKAVAIGLGATLEFFAGAVKRAPRWMQGSGLEWMYRLGQQPRRLAKRYLIDDMKFAPILVRELRLPRSQRIQL